MRTLKSKRWPWLTEGWEVVEDVMVDKHLAFLSPPPRQWFDPGYVTIPADRIAFEEKQ
jgi:hypothetical protein